MWRASESASGGSDKWDLDDGIRRGVVDQVGRRMLLDIGVHLL